MAKNQVLRMTTVNLSQQIKGDPETSEKLFNLYTKVTCLRKEAVKQQRLAMIVQARAAVAMAATQEALSEFMSFSGEISEKVAVEANWLPPFTGSDGDIMVESPYTQRDQRIAARVAYNQLSKAVENSDEDLGLDYADEGDE